MANRRAKSSPVPIHSVLAELVRKKKWQRRFELHQVFEQWQSLVGAEIGRHAQPQRYRGKVLWVDVSDSVWYQQLQFLKSDLLVKLNSFLPHEEVEDIRFQLTNDFSVKNDQPAPPPPRAKIAPSAADESAMDAMLESVEDEELRQAMKRCWHNFYKSV